MRPRLKTSIRRWTRWPATGALPDSAPGGSPPTPERARRSRVAARSGFLRLLALVALAALVLALVWAGRAGVARADATPMPGPGEGSSSGPPGDTGEPGSGPGEPADSPTSPGDDTTEPALGSVLFADPADTGAHPDRPWQDDIIYLVMVDRFANGDPSNDQEVNTGSSTSRHGGDLQGVIDRLDYIKSLGVTAIWLTPVADNQSNGYHGYWITDFERVDPHLGDLTTLRELVREAHERGMKVLLDMVVNHTAPLHPWVSDPTKQDWFHHAGGINDWNDQAEIENGQLSGLPDLAQENPEVADYLISVSKAWVRATGVDGFRLDTVRHVPKDFWTRFAAEMDATAAGFFLLGEAWNDDPAYVAAYQDTGIDAMLDFARQSAITQVFGLGGSPALLHQLQAAEEAAFSDPSLVGTFIDNHDVPRFVAAAAPGGQAKLRAALAYLLTAPGVPVVYYGTEVGLQGGGDPDNRRDMKFDSNPELTDYFRQLAFLRQAEPVLRQGDYLPLEVEVERIDEAAQGSAAAPAGQGGAGTNLPSGGGNPSSQVLAYARTPDASDAGGGPDAGSSPASAADRPAFVVINCGASRVQAVVDLPVGPEGFGRLSDHYLRDALGPVPASRWWRVRRQLELTLDPYQAMILVPDKADWFAGLVVGDMVTREAALLWGLFWLVALCVLVWATIRWAYRRRQKRAKRKKD